MCEGAKVPTRALGVLLLGFLALGCKPKYPACENDEDCRAKEFCVQTQCRQCRQNADCPQGSECKAGACAALPKLAKNACADDAQCPEGKSCINGECKACAADDECGPGGKCRGGKCLRPGGCDRDEDCPQHMDCIGGRCVADTKVSRTGIPDCALGSIYFGFDQATLEPKSTNELQRMADCIKRSPVGVQLVGHTDSRGTDEYNLALSERRAIAARDYLERLGVPAAKMRSLPRGELDASGHDEDSWARDRRVELRWP